MCSGISVHSSVPGPSGCDGNANVGHRFSLFQRKHHRGTKVSIMHIVPTLTDLHIMCIWPSIISIIVYLVSGPSHNVLHTAILSCAVTLIHSYSYSAHSVAGIEFRPQLSDTRRKCVIHCVMVLILSIQ